ncbi:hypothetical protein BDF22DRAFT_668144 [Syncephalis plumigaleata]|nr:hypothetical protein BDF22DRAFT_668144 [Syncephalis plumigaleata]
MALLFVGTCRPLVRAIIAGPQAYKKALRLYSSTHGGLRRSRFLTGDNLLKEVNRTTTEAWTLDSDKPVISMAYYKQCSRLINWLAQCRNEQVKVIAIDLFPSMTVKKQPFTVVLSDGQVARILPAYYFDSPQLMLGEFMMNDEITKVTMNANNLVKQLWKSDHIESRNVVDIREIGWPGVSNGLGLNVNYAESFKALYGRSIIENQDIINSNWKEASLTDEQNRYATNYIQSLYMMYLKLCTLQQISHGNATDCQYQRYDGGAKSTKTTIHGYLPRPIIGTSRQTAARSKISIPSIQNISTNTSIILPKITTKQAIAALESYEKARQLAGSTSSNNNVTGSTKTTATQSISTTSNDSTDAIINKPKIRKVPRRTVSDAMDNAFKNIFDQMSTYKSDIEKRMVEPTSLESSSTIDTTTTVTTTTTTSTVTTSDPVQVQETLKELTELLQDPQRLSILQQIIATLKEQTPSSH